MSDTYKINSDIELNGEINLPQQSTPSAPNYGRLKLYAKSDGNLYKQDYLGNELEVNNNSSGGLTSWQVTTLHVDGNRSDSYTADGSIYKPYKTIMAALNQAATLNIYGGVAVEVANAIYSEDIDLDSITNLNTLYNFSLVAPEGASVEKFNSTLTNNQLYFFLIRNFLFNNIVTCTASDIGFAAASPRFDNCQFQSNISITGPSDQSSEIDMSNCQVNTNISVNSSVFYIQSGNGISGTLTLTDSAFVVLEKTVVNGNISIDSSSTLRVREAANIGYPGNTITNYGIIQAYMSYIRSTITNETGATILNYGSFFLAPITNSGTITNNSNMDLSYFTSGVIDTDGTLNSNSNFKLATQKAMKTYADQILVAAGALTYKGVIDGSKNPNYPAAVIGDTYKVSVTGLIGGISGVNVTQNDLIICLVANSGGIQSVVGVNFDIIQTNLTGSVIGPANSTDGDIVIFNGVSGALIEDSGYQISSFVQTSTTVNGHALSSNISVSASDISLGNVTNDAQLKIASNLSDLNSTSSARSNLGLGGAAVLSVGTTSGTVAAGNDSRITGAVQNTTTVNGHALSSNISVTASDISLGNVTNDAQLKIASNLSDLNSTSSARSNLGLGGAATLNIGTTPTTVATIALQNTSPSNTSIFWIDTSM